MQTIANWVSDLSKAVDRAAHSWGNTPPPKWEGDRFMKRQVLTLRDAYGDPAHLQGDGVAAMDFYRNMIHAQWLWIQSEGGSDGE